MSEIPAKWTLITKWTTDKKRSIVSKDHTFFTDAEEVLVFWKWSMVWRKVHEVGHGMDVVVWFERWEHAVKIDPTMIENGLGLYQEFDEEKNKVISYLYGFWNDQESVELMNELLGDFGITNTVVVDGKFTVFKDPVSQIDPKKMHSIDGLVSILIGMLLWYGTLVGDDDALFHASIELPMVGSIAQYEELFGWVTYLLKEQWLYIRTEYTTHRNHQIWSVGIYDWELLWLVSELLGDERVVGKKDEAYSLKESCEELTGKKFGMIKLFKI